MYKKIIYFIFFLSLTIGSFAQQANKGRVVTVKGQVKDIFTRPLSYATVMLMKAGDTTSILSVGADSLGKYAFQRALPIGNYTLYFRHVGYATTGQYLAIDSAKTEFTVPDILMDTSSADDLADVVVKSVIPVSVKGDTMAFNADAFHVKPNATAEDLLKKLPGIEIDASGNIQAQGESVGRVLVNGKRFFGNDPKMATQNLPKDIVDKIEIYDAQSDQSAFSGFDDGNRVKTINIVIKKDKNVGYFGKMTAGAGRSDQNLYNVGGNINRFNNDQKISVLGQVNNVNSQMFTMQDLSGGNGRFSGGGRGAGASGSFGGSSAGIAKTIAAGINYADKWKNTDFSGSYFYNNTKTFNDGHSERQNLYQDSTENTNQYDTTSTVSWNKNHRIQLNVESKLDSNNAITVRPTLSFINTDNYSNSITDIFKDNNGQRTYITKSAINSTSHNSGYNGSGNALYQHRFGGTAGRTMSFGIDWSGNKNDGYGYNTNNINYVSQNKDSLINRYYISNSNGNTIGGTFSYTEPIAKYQQIELNYNHTYTRNNSQRTTYDYDSTTGKYDNKNVTLTNDFQNTYNSDRATLGYHYNNSTINFSAGSGFQFGRLNSLNRSTGLTINQRYTNFYPTASFRWNMAQARRLNFDYSGRTTQPSISQLQPVLDNSNQLSQTIGNADLKQSFTHSIRARYFFFDRGKNTHLFSMLSYSTVQNSIANITTRLSNGGQLVSYTNLSGNYSINGSFDYGFPIVNPASNFSMRTNLSASKSPNLIVNPITNSTYYDTSKNITRNYSFGERIGWTTNLQSTFDVNISTEPQYTISKYSVSSTGTNTNYFSQNVNLEGTWYTASGWQATANFNYTYYTGLYNTSVPLLNVSFSRMLFKNKAGEIKLSVNDLLNQNKAITNTRTNNYILQSTNTVLKRYVMLSFVYNLKQFGKKGNSGDRRNRQFGEDGPGGMPPGGGFGGGRPPMGPMGN